MKNIKTRIIIRKCGRSKNVFYLNNKGREVNCGCFALWIKDADIKNIIEHEIKLGEIRI